MSRHANNPFAQAHNDVLLAEPEGDEEREKIVAELKNRGNAAFKVAELKGLKIRSHWTRQAQKLMGGRRGCTHLFELLRPIATTCFQTMSGSSSREDSGYQINPGKVAKQPFFINSCHALAADGDIVKTFWPEFYDGYN